MSAYAILISVHVVVAVMGVGALAAIPLGARTARRNELQLIMLASWLQPLFRLMRASLAIMLLSGAALEYTLGGPFHDTWWFRLSFALLIIAGFCQRGASRALRRGLDASLDNMQALKRVEGWGWTSAIAVACICILMELKPF